MEEGLLEFGNSLGTVDLSKGDLQTSNSLYDFNDPMSGDFITIYLYSPTPTLNTEIFRVDLIQSSRMLLNFPIINLLRT